MKKVVTMYFDSYESTFGDGFYPMVHPDQSCDSQIDIEFELHDRKLTQLTGPIIKGYDGDTYNDIIESFFTNTSNNGKGTTISQKARS
jgi:hypothetical protein